MKIVLQRKGIGWLFLILLKVKYKCTNIKTVFFNKQILAIKKSLLHVLTLKTVDNASFY
jgi:hypothetical protein